MSTKPGIYKIIDEKGEILYIGKAKNLKKRLTNYTKPKDLQPRLARMVFLARKVEYEITTSEAEAFLLEARLIKLHMPRFNILLKDDKSYPFIKINMSHEFPQILKYRGKNVKDPNCFGPFASNGDVERTIKIIKKIFKIRGCTDSYFAGRKRPCLQYQIKACSGPCVAKISKQEYIENVDNAVKFLKGKSAALQEILSKTMNKYADELNFEKAAEVRDSLKALSYIQVNSYSAKDGIDDADVISVLNEKNIYSVQIFFYRAGQNYGSNIYFPRHAEGATNEEVLSSFLGQFYQQKVPPRKIIVNINFEDKATIEDALYRLHGCRAKIKTPKTGQDKKLLDHANENALENLKKHIASHSKNLKALERVMNIFGLDEIPKRIEVYDNSHIMGKFAIGAMIVAGPNGLEKNEYRKYTLKVDTSATGGDDYQMLHEVLLRRIKRFASEPHRIPSLIIIDGGKGHMGVVANLFIEHNINVPFVCMSKGEKRNAGFETFHMIGKESFTLDNSEDVMKYLQLLRDEVHNFAITGHRRKRSKAIVASAVDQIPSIGPNRKKLLLNYFGSYEAIKNASIKDLAKVPGISENLAEKIYSYNRSLPKR
ncbi:MAG: excinuclease ABC subunit UvrC [Rickettsiaceae bacterium]|nr:excinuclease ABC subunit UvrC [Rickettsiaceae bacterium]